MTEKENFACFVFSETWRHLGIAQTSLALLSVCTSFPCEDLFLVTGTGTWVWWLLWLMDLSPRLVWTLDEVYITKFPPLSDICGRKIGNLQRLVTYFCQILRWSQKKFVILQASTANRRKRRRPRPRGTEVPERRVAVWFSLVKL